MIFGLMHGESHLIMRRARRDPDNDEFFRQINPATIRDSIPPVIMVVCLLGLGAYTFAAPGSTDVVAFGFLASLLLLTWHLVFMAMF